MKILSAKFMTSAAKPPQFPADDKPQVAFAGRSNVGKSSLINAILNRKSLVKTSATREDPAHQFFSHQSAILLRRPSGYGYAKAPRSVVDAWAPMIEGYIKDSRQIRIVIVLLDIRREPDERDARLIAWLAHYCVPAFYVLTKADKLKRGETARALQSITKKLGLDQPPLLTSVLTGQGIVELKAEIAKRLNRGPGSGTAKA